MTIQETTMTTFNKNKNSFRAAVNVLQPDFHAFTALEVSRDTKNPIQEKRAILSQIKSLVESIDTDDFGIRVVVMKSKN